MAVLDARRSDWLNVAALILLVSHLISGFFQQAVRRHCREIPFKKSHLSTFYAGE
ncbi:unnamed protein product [Cylicostephanus goldi]|uniref:Uncharacterized protein n=1 Tax=Cylicostephanus goldi TaxID=71465 RepID=A0A3P7RDX7_CYLGO|nr:unnamed protein product [Cylicostephanus goldi]